MDLPITLKLHKPVEHGSRVIEELVFSRELEAKDLFDLPPAGWKVGDYAQIASRLTGQPLPVLARLGLVDLTKVMRTVEDFLPDGRTTGDGA